MKAAFGQRPMASENKDESDLIKRLDELLTQYLHLLDVYTQARDKLNQDLSTVSPPSKNYTTSVQSRLKP